jgi:hypothetical protein
MIDKRTIFKMVEEDYLPPGIMEMYAYTLYSNKNRLLSVLSALNKELEKGNKCSNITKSIGFINTILKEYKDTVSFKESQLIENKKTNGL